MSRALLIATTFFLASCNYNYIKTPGEGGGAVVDEESFNAPDYETVAKAVLIPQCVSCHSNAKGNKGDANLETYARVRALINRIEFRALEKRNMPPEGLSERDAQLLRNWIDLGMPEKNVPIGEKPDPELERGANDWPKVRDKIFAKKCFDCHSGDNPEKGLNLSELNQVKANILEILNRIYIDQQRPMPPAPIPAVTPKERRVILQWFNLGMPQ